MQRQAATSKGLDKRLRDVHFERVKDDRYAPNVRFWSFPAPEAPACRKER